MRPRNSFKSICTFFLLLCFTGLASGSPKETELYRPGALLRDIENIENGKTSLLESSYHAFFNRFNMLNPTPMNAASSSADTAMKLAFHFLGDKKPELKKERYRLSKARWGYELYLQLFPNHKKFPEAKKHIERLSKRIDEIDKVLEKDGIVIPEETRPEPKSLKWILLGDDWMRDLGSAAPAFAISGTSSLMGVGIYQSLMIAMRAYRANTNGGLSREELKTEIEYLAAFVKVVTPEERPLYLMRLAKTYEFEGSARSLIKAYNIYKSLSDEGAKEPSSKDYLGKGDAFQENIMSLFEFKKDKSTANVPFGSHMKRVRENIAAAMKTYAVNYGDRDVLKELAADYPDTEAGKKAKEMLDSGEKLEPKIDWARQLSVGGRVSANGFDFYGSGYNIFGEEEKISAGIANGRYPYADVEVPFVHQWLGGRTPVIRAGPGWLSFVLNPAKEKPHLDEEFFSK